MFTAWHVEAFQRTKRLPKLASVMKRMERVRARQNLTPEQIWQGFKRHNARLGGADNRKKKS